MSAFWAGFALGAGASWWLLARRRRRLGRFFAFAAHELNSPVTALNMTVLNLLNGVFGPVSADQELWLSLMREQASRLGGMVGEMGDFVRLEMTGELRMRLEDLDLSEALQTAANSVERGLAHAGVGLKKDIAVGLPKVRADSERLGRTLQSLLLHARKFRSSGDILVAASSPGGRSVCVRVEFAGTKTSAEDAERSLDLYFPILKPGHVLPATGMGLGLLRTLARRQGGELSLGVEADGRQRLKLTLPAAAPGEAP